LGVHTLITGINGAGKTLYAVAEKLRPMRDATVEYRGETRPRRIVQGGIKGLLIEHELMDVPEIDPEIYVDEWKSHVREPGTPPVPDVPWSILNWWLWCEPGDYIVVDECQRVFRPMASGKRVPMFISKLETARHYGVEFLYLTQHPQLLHQNVRRLVGPHEDVRRIFGGSRTMIYQWDRVSDPDRIAKATARYWKHDKSAFALYKSAEIHNKFGQRLPLAVWGLIGGVIALVALGWVLKGRLHDRFAGVAPGASSASAPGRASGAAPGATPKSSGEGWLTPTSHPKVETASDRDWPTYVAEPVKVNREPLDGRAVQWEGGYSLGKDSVTYFGLFVDGERVSTVTLAQLASMGYVWKSWGPCVGSLRFGKLERLVTCAKHVEVKHEAAPMPLGTASAPALPGVGSLVAAVVPGMGS
jgi:zona occludens toxin